MVVAGHESAQGALDNEHSLYLTLLLQLKWASLIIFDFSMNKRIITVVNIKYIQIFYAYLIGA